MCWKVYSLICTVVDIHICKGLTTTGFLVSLPMLTLEFNDILTNNLIYTHKHIFSYVPSNVVIKH